MDYRLTATLLDSLGIALCVFDDQHRTVLWNQSFLRFFPEHDGHVHAGEPYADNLRRFYRQRLAPDDLRYLERHVADGIARHVQQTRPYVFQHRGRWLRVAASSMGDGHRVRIWLEVAEAALPMPTQAPALPPADRPTDDALQMLEHAGDGASVQSGDGRIVFASDHFLAMYGLPSKVAALGRSYAEVVRQHWASACAPDEYAARAEDIVAALHDSLNFAGVPFEVPLPGGRWVRVAMNRMADGQTCAFHTDISTDKRRQDELRALTDQLREESLHDALTGLQNRRGLHSIVQTLSGQPGPHALLYIDLDGFKAVNDAAGHGAGDQVLCQVAVLLRQSVRMADTLVRIGGDEFVVVLQACETQQAQAVGTKIVQAIHQQDFAAEGARFRVGASVGVRVFSSHSDSPDVVLHDADVACYRAKHNGRGRVEVFGAGG
ncbi:diguanylate cyclase [Acidovorax sp. SUPP1855]|uniref:sensor domain-containing diguanylate cyclase n=1 Tax=Acidovorax sp. SUPP1855 TaxID=431774 RepID=UPI0023DE5426|nr:sensor domain-containing diguanylate cyclase [Acidovorax sp. SUPP1855]GKS84841.1 diguanylate cyclase [Acidovorax sp. SUPP1855]